MARIVLGMAVPHSGMLGRTPEDLLEDGERDRKKDELWYRCRRLGAKTGFLEALLCDSRSVVVVGRNRTHNGPDTRAQRK